jgi:para-nitrobenzyl esterase
VPLVETSHGVVRGEGEGPVCVFRGVPYAAAPVGTLRWRSPRPVVPWAGVRDATSFGPIAPQDTSPERLAKRGATMSEDCLTLNVWTPAADDGRRPVLVFIHGGGVVVGSGSAPLLDGSRLAARGDLVVVTFNFRLGALGSLLAPERLGEDGDPATNLAFRDQLAALRWVRREIGAVGGDPRNVTVAGQSSGAVAIACMLAGRAAAGAFDRAILQSGGLERVRSTAAGTAVARRFFAALGVDDPFDRTGVTVDAILAAQRTIPTGFVPPVGPFHHAIDGDVIPEHPLLTAESHPMLAVPVLAGTTRDEWRAFDTALADVEVTDDFLRARVRALAGDDEIDADEILDRYRTEHARGDALQRRRAVASALVTDFHFAAPTEQFVRAHAARGNPVRHYELQWESPRPDLGACHDMCLPLLFGTMDRSPTLAGAGPEASAMSEALQDAWIGFVRSGDPSTPTLGTWEPYDGNRRPTMLLGATPRVVERHRSEFLGIWHGRYPVTG